MAEPDSTETEKTTDTKTNNVDMLVRRQSGRRVLMLGIGILILLAGLIAFYRYRTDGNNNFLTIQNDQSGDLTVTSAPSEAPKEYSTLDGTLVTATEAHVRPLAVIIENHPDARPQSGLDKASVVYEALSEGGITRFLALYGPQTTTKAGPVRSARTYFLDWLLEYDAAFGHVGGNRDALDLIPQLGIHDLDQFAIGNLAYRRESRPGRATEHTMYADTNKLQTIASDQFGLEQNWSPPTFQDGVTRDHRPASQTVAIDFSSGSYVVAWTYDPETNSYLRSLAGILHKDAESDVTIRADNIFVQEVARQTAPTTRDGEEGWQMTTIGNGRADVFQNGQHIEATWKKDSRTAPTKFFDPSGAEIKRNRGTTWFEIIPPGTKVTIDQPI